MVQRLLALSALVQLGAALQAPNTSLATVPTAYFGGNYLRRPDSNVEMLAKMRIVMIEKWEGPCWQDCLADPSSAACTASCNVENYILDTHTRIKKINPNVTSILYLNTLLDFPFYTLHGVLKNANALTIDNTTNLPLVLRNDNGMEGIYVFGMDTEAGQEIYVNAISNYTSTGVIDGFFGDKFNKAATLNSTSNQWTICNHVCGTVSAEVAANWNAGKVKVINAVNKALGDSGLWFANGGQFEGVQTNFYGSWNTQAMLHSGDPRDLAVWVKGEDCLANHTYCYLSSTGDEHWTTNPNDPSSLVTACDDQCLGRFLLAVEEGVFLGTNGWDEQYYYPLGTPLGDAVYTPASKNSAATLVRKFESGTYVTFTYSKSVTHRGIDGTSVIYWQGRPPVPTPPPSPSPAPPGPPLVCGSCGSSQLPNTTFAGNDVADPIMKLTVAECCSACASNPACVRWSQHGAVQGNLGKQGCHLHGKQTISKHQEGTVSGLLFEKDGCA